jgi:membrane protein implicated in regulation of membrane protease activity
MGWFLLILVLIAIAFGILGAVIKAAVFVVLTLITVVVLLALIGRLLIRHQLNKISDSFQRRSQLP